ncbi:receptor-like protein 2 [Pyrus ussuriensis x Pyrus communis]|uniref:Receptor-like protein 2 n=1 Tax=Pyrus ussuriensis x Pyrus communis TaxID=2448454 RepID=A0A5N5HA28_9ROSA|nr:receptor-like protein 2 [Pyrus ussuriensis x Pyrus communis]
MTMGLTEAQEREACVDSFLPSPSQTTKYLWEFSRSVENNMIWVSKSDKILLDLWKPVVRIMKTISIDKAFATMTSCYSC